ncbi:hypothetical protein B0T17DRAFT_274327 [Bombardia bombarda]|uniref:Cyanovirin-N domain-containing protein n=1 Tax=Bombardia bombarda TaxID=252184 RepID=A0AA39X1C4_9PEZI|nr:hypothetical protein B0T17DRAFT_274327 [Bombardia bombarda]
MHLPRFFFLILAAALPAFVAAAGKYHNFSESCTDMQLTGNAMLNAECWSTPDHSTAKPASIDLNQCIGIDQTSATLIWAFNGKLVNYCSGCSLYKGLVLTCVCSSLSGDPSGVFTVLELGELNSVVLV